MYIKGFIKNHMSVEAAQESKITDMGMNNANFILLYLQDLKLPPRRRERGMFSFCVGIPQKQHFVIVFKKSRNPRKKRIYMEQSMVSVLYCWWPEWIYVTLTKKLNIVHVKPRNSSPSLHK